MADIAGLTSAFGAPTSRTQVVSEEEPNIRALSASDAARAAESDPAGAIVRGFPTPEITPALDETSVNVGEGAPAPGRFIEDVVTLSAEAQDLLAAASNENSATDQDDQTRVSAFTAAADEPSALETAAAAATERAAGVAAAEEADEAVDATNQVAENENDSSEIEGNQDNDVLSAQSRELGQIVDQFA
ncbi:MAG: hypothetical protein QNJ84_18445 [Alphaproteobacteria bacterium]|nr:hypothetical protein [Alphaproteobacteria bacterium]